MMENDHVGVVVKGRTIIDIRPPFRSVKEAVALFGERVLVREIYANQLKQMQHVTKPDMKKENVTWSTIGAVSAELEETKENLEKAREEGNYIANCIKSLEEQLEETKRELRNLKAAKDPQQQHTKAMNPEVEEVELFEINGNANNNFDDNRGKKIVTFASPPCLTREIKLSFVDDERVSKFGRSSSFKKEGTKKPVVAIMGWLFPKKKRINYQGDLN